MQRSSRVLKVAVLLVIALCFWSIAYAFASEPEDAPEGQSVSVEAAESASSIADDLEADSEDEPESNDAIEAGDGLDASDVCDDPIAESEDSDSEFDVAKSASSDVVDGEVATDEADLPSPCFTIDDGNVTEKPVIDTWLVGTPDASVLEYVIYTDKGTSKGYNGFKIPAIGTFSISYDEHLTRLCFMWDFNIGTDNTYAEQWFKAADFYMTGVLLESHNKMDVLGSEVAHYRDGNTLYRVYEVNFPDDIDNIRQLHPTRDYVHVDPVMYGYSGFTKQVGENLDGEPEFHNFLLTQAWVSRGEYDVPTIDYPDPEPAPPSDPDPLPAPPSDPEPSPTPDPEPERPVIAPNPVPSVPEANPVPSAALAQTGDDMGMVIVVLLVVIGLVVVWLLTGEHSPLKGRSKFYFGGSRMVRVVVTVAVLLVVSLVLKAFGLI